MIDDNLAAGILPLRSGEKFDNAVLRNDGRAESEALVLFRLRSRPSGVSGLESMVDGPLAGVRVAEIGEGMALAYCGKLFADFGASVVKIEPPGGAPERVFPPLVDVGGGELESAYFAWLNTNKRSVVADFASDNERLLEVISASDVLLDGRNPASTVATSPLGHGALRDTLPDLSVVSLSWFGETGPYRDFRATDSIVRALAGLVKLAGPAEEPAMQTEYQGNIVGGLCAFTAALASLYAGGGRRFEISVHEANAVLTEYQAAMYVGLGLEEERYGVNRWYASYPLGNVRCQDGWLGITVLTPDQWRSFCDLMSMPAAATDPRFATSASRMEHSAELEAIYLPRFQERTVHEWFAEGLRLRLPFVAIPSMSDLLAEPVYRGRQAFAEVSIGKARFEAPRLPLRLDATPPIAGGRAPLAGADTATWSAAPPRPRPAGRRPGLALAGLRIIDLSMGWAGPLATRQMADLGAEVIKVEGRAYPDWWRSADYLEESIRNFCHEKRLWFNILNRNKTGITLDLTHKDGASLLKRLVGQADVVIENYSPGVLPKLGLQFSELRKIKSDLVMVRMPAFGGATDWAEVRAYGSTLEQASGLPGVTGRDHWPPMLNHAAYGDPIGGLNAAAALLLAVLHRAWTGKGQLVDLSQVECMFPLVAPWVIEQSVNGEVANRRGNRHPSFVPHGCFRCAGEDAWLVVTATSDSEFRALCLVIGRPDLASDPTLAHAEGRRAAEDQLESAISAWTITQDADAAMVLLQNARVPAGVARGYAELMLREPHLEQRGFWQEVDRPHIGWHRQPSPTFREDGLPCAIRFPAPLFGQSSREVLASLAGLSDLELDWLEANYVIGCDPIPTSQRRARGAAIANAARG